MALDISQGLERLGTDLMSAGQTLANAYLGLQRQAESGSSQLYNAEVQIQYLRGHNTMMAGLDALWSQAEQDKEWATNYPKYESIFQEAWPQVMEQATALTLLPEAKAKLEAEAIGVFDSTRRSVLQFSQTKQREAALTEFRSGVTAAVERGDQREVATYYDAAAAGQFRPADELAVNRVKDMDLAHYNSVVRGLNANNDPQAVWDSLVARGQAASMKQYDIDQTQYDNLVKEFGVRATETKKLSDRQALEFGQKQWETLVETIANDQIQGRGPLVQLVLSVDDAHKSAALSFLADYDKVTGGGFQERATVTQNVNNQKMLTAIAKWGASSPKTDGTLDTPGFTLEDLPKYVAPSGGKASFIREEQTGAIRDAWADAEKRRATIDTDPLQRKAADMRLIIASALTETDPLKQQNPVLALPLATIHAALDNRQITPTDHDLILKEVVAAQKTFEEDKSKDSESFMIWAATLATDYTKNYEQKIDLLKVAFTDKKQGGVSSKTYMWWRDQMDPWSKNKDYEEIGKGLDAYYNAAIPLATDENKRKELAQERYTAKIDLSNFMAAHASDSNPLRAYQDEMYRYLQGSATKLVIDSISALPGKAGQVTFQPSTSAGINVFQNYQRGVAFEVSYAERQFRLANRPLTGAQATEYRAQRSEIMASQKRYMEWKGVWKAGTTQATNKLGDDEYTTPDGKKYVVIPFADADNVVRETLYRVTYPDPKNLLKFSYDVVK